ncbi:MAG: quinolinate synthase NadA [Candidatus Stahlbacteria bacterium]|nr:quinolinate synthase NadA [Candidatus Stahlbacteria bacterium]
MENVIENIKELKTKKSAIILVHNYQRPEIQDIADYIGDSLGLSKKASELTCKLIIFCGVKFMAESAKILSPQKKVILPNKQAGCQMADMVTVDELKQLKSKHPDAAVVCYVNTNADVKAECDVCCTSANAVKVVQNIEAKKIIFVPDKNLANYVQRFTDKEIIPYNGYCYVHEKITPEDVKQARQIHKEAVIIVHPECRKEVIDLVVAERKSCSGGTDEVLSTDGMIRYAKSSNAKKIIVGTEEGILYRLKKENPDKLFYTLGPARMCKNMKLTTLSDVYFALLEEQYEIEIDEQIKDRAKRALDKMLDYT